MTCDWPQLLDNATQPLYVQHAANGYFRAWLGDINALYIRLFRIADIGKRPIGRFFADTVAEASRKRPKHVIIDLRGDGGGNYFLARSFAKKIDSLVPGNVFIVTDSGTFSAALVRRIKSPQSAVTRPHARARFIRTITLRHRSFTIVG